MNNEIITFIVFTGTKEGTGARSKFDLIFDYTEKEGKVPWYTFEEWDWEDDECEVEVV